MKHAPVIPARRIQAVCSIYAMAKFGMAYGTNAMRQQTVVSGNWPAANRAIYLPFEVESAFVINSVAAYNGAGAAAGSWDIGVYTLDGTRLVSTGTFAQSGSNTYQSSTTNLPIQLTRGWYYMALMATSTSTTVYHFPSGAAGDYIGWGPLQEATGGTLPATATFAANTTAFVPFFGLHSVTI